MKFATLILSLMLPLAAFAGEGQQLICVENSAPAGHAQRAFILKQIGQQVMQEGQAYAFQVELLGFAANQPELVIPVIATQEDVIVNFSSADGQLSGTLFKDELDQTALRVNGETIGFNCQ